MSEPSPRPPPWRAVVATLFPEMFPGPLGFSLLGRARENAIWTLKALDFRAFSSDKHRSVDDTPVGGGPGLVMRPDIVAAAIDAGLAEFGGDAASDGASRPPVIYLSPRGAPFTQARARALAAGPGAVLLCGRFEGVDQRALEARRVEEIAIGDAVMTGGEIAAMAVLDAALRLLPGVIGDPASLDEESFADGLLEHPQYTRPPVWEGRAVPEILRSGDHARIAAWRRDQALTATQERRPDLWRAHLARRSAGETEAPAHPEQSDAATTGPAPTRDASGAGPTQLQTPGAADRGGRPDGPPD